MTKTAKQVSFRDHGASKPLKRNDGGPVAEWSCRGLQISSKASNFNAFLQFCRDCQPRRINDLRVVCKILALAAALASVGQAHAFDVINEAATRLERKP